MEVVGVFVDVCVIELVEVRPYHFFSLSVVSQLGGERARGEPLFEQLWKTNKTATACGSSLGNT